MNRFHHIAENENPDQVRAEVVKFVQDNYSTEEILRRVPRSVADAFMGDYLSATEQSLTRIHAPESDIVIIQGSPE